MKQVLVINSSLQGENSNSNKAAQRYVDALQVNETIQLTSVDVHADNIPHLQGLEMQAWGIAEEQRDEEQKALAAISDNYVAQVQQADEIVLAIPMYNFGVPSTLKAYFDRIARAGVTFQYTENGPIGLLEGKKVTVIAARGGKYEGTAMDSQTTFVRDFLAFIGLTNVTFYYIEGLAMGEEANNDAWHQFNQKLVN
ncbi:MAG: NAD(P)H-dependent oxidoreductase [Glaciecola sp.]